MPRDLLVTVGALRAIGLYPVSRATNSATTGDDHDNGITSSVLYEHRALLPRPPSRRSRMKKPAWWKKMRKVIMNPLKKQHTWLEKKYDALLIAATLIAAMAYQAALNPPGGLWQEDTIEVCPRLFENGPSPNRTSEEEQSLEWSKECQSAFSAMKRAMSEDPVLALLDVSKSFEVHTNASDFALEGVLMQECHPVAYESRKLNEAERRYTAHEKELLAVVHCLRVWGDYLLGSSFIVQTDNTAVSHFLSQSKLTSKQARWQELLAEFNFMLKYRAGSTNSVADALSRRAELDQVALMAMNAIVRTDSRVAINIGKKIRKGLTRDPVAQQLLKLIESGKTQQFWQEDGLLMTKGRRYWGMPQDIVSDRDSHFTGNFWTELFKLFGSQLSMSSSYHPESDGQTERFNSMLEEYLRHFVSATQKNWVKLLDVAQLCSNSRKSSSTGKNAFEIVNGQQPLLAHTVNVPNAGKSPRAISFSKEWRQNIDLAHSYLEKATRRMKKHADKNRRSQEYVGDKVMVKLLPHDLKFLKGRDSRLLQKYEGPLTIVKKIGKMAYKVDPPHWWNRQLRHVFHTKPTPPGAKSRDKDSNPKVAGKRVAEAILNDRVITASRKRHQEYLVKWQVYMKEENTWERAADLSAYTDKIEAYQMQKLMRASTALVGENVTAAPCTSLASRPHAHPTQLPRAHPAQLPRAPPTYTHAPCKVFQVSRPCAGQAQRPHAQLQCPRTPKANREDLKIQACIVRISWRTLLASGKSSATHGFLCAIKGHPVSHRNSSLTPTSDVTQ
ncbi:hypothetical protein RJ639_014706 [Escallonia herrerae]|uniref:Chromo domain-containing protein n=1 Tax=Escallonia herrerae TaxID=1293975 RepID=A0AA89ALT9_9ASTE|nr:hypothetical protein RJ639_014706 [Escallonia herrerae]